MPSFVFVSFRKLDLGKVGVLRSSSMVSRVVAGGGGGSRGKMSNYCQFFKGKGYLERCPCWMTRLTYIVHPIREIIKKVTTGSILLRGIVPLIGQQGPSSSSIHQSLQQSGVVTGVQLGHRVPYYLGSPKKVSKVGDLSVNIMTAKPNVVFVLGGPGAGKGTQCRMIVEKYGFIHLSAGDLLREERNNPGSEFGELIEKHIRDGTIVPVEITCSLIEKAMIKSGHINFLIDGFPRNQNNLDGWNRQMSDKVNVLFVLFIDCPEDICVGRCLDRGQAGSGRSDDNPDSLKKRVLTYMNDTVPIINYFEGKQLVRKVNATKNPDEVFEEVKNHFANISIT